MTNILTKWGAVVVLIIVLGSIVMMFSSGAAGLSNWIGDNYLPKKYMIIEKYPVRIIMYGQFMEEPLYLDQNGTSRTANLIYILQQLDKMEYRKGTFSDYNMNIKVDSDFNSKQIRSSSRAIRAGLPKE